MTDKYMGEGELKRIKDCLHAQADRCPRLYEDGLSNDFCAGDGLAWGGTEMLNCDRWVCDKLEKEISWFSNEQIREQICLKNIRTADGNSITVISLDLEAEQEKRNEKANVVIDEEGNTYFPLKSAPDIYHINRKIKPELIGKIGEIFQLLREQKNINI